MKQLADLAVVGLAVMGENLALNAESRGFTVTVYNRSRVKTIAFTTGRGQGKKFIPASTLPEMVSSLKTPRKILLMIKAGKAVDETIEALIPLLSTGDILIDGGNSLYTDTESRLQNLSTPGIHYIGCGISGGEAGALNGPSLMPGGDQTAWPYVKPVLEAIAALAPDGKKCCSWMGPGGAGHFVKMVHNGIEYGYMQIITEIYQLLRDVFRLDSQHIGKLFQEWNSGKLESYLMEITSRVLSVTDTDGTPLVDRIVDSAGQKGTGRWTVEAALSEGVPLGIITEAVFFRALSADQTLRKVCHENLDINTPPELVFAEVWSRKLADTLLMGQFLAFSQGFSLISKMSSTKGWDVPLDQVAGIWREGCIIRSALLDDIALVFTETRDIPSLMASPHFREMTKQKAASLKEVVALAIQKGIPVPALSSAVNYLSALAVRKTGINLLQAQRDFFGAHTFERTDRPAGEFHHFDWINPS